MDHDTWLESPYTSAGDAEAEYEAFIEYLDEEYEEVGELGDQLLYTDQEFMFYVSEEDFRFVKHEGWEYKKTELDHSELVSYILEKGGEK